MKTVLMLADGFELCEAMITVDLFRRANVEIHTVSINETVSVTSAQKVELKADYVLKDVTISDYDCVILPGGLPGTYHLEECNELINEIKQMANGDKFICAICAAPSILGHLGLLEGKHYTCYPGWEDDSYKGTHDPLPAVQDGHIVTGRGMGCTIEFALKILSNVLTEEKIDELKKGIQFNH